MEREIDFYERKVLLVQDRIAKQRDKVATEVKKLERRLREQEEIRKEWIKKMNAERERLKTDRNDAMNSHRHVIDEYRIKYEEERANKLRDVKTMIMSEEDEIRELQKQRDELVMVTKSEEAQIKARYQIRINDLLREEQAAMRSGVVRQKRLLDAPNIYSMSVEKRGAPMGMKKRSYQPRRAI